MIVSNTDVIWKDSCSCSCKKPRYLKLIPDQRQWFHSQCYNWINDKYSIIFHQKGRMTLLYVSTEVLYTCMDNESLLSSALLSRLKIVKETSGEYEYCTCSHSIPLLPLQFPISLETCWRFQTCNNTSYTGRVPTRATSAEGRIWNETTSLPGRNRTPHCPQTPAISARWAGRRTTQTCLTSMAVRSHRSYLCPYPCDYSSSQHRACRPRSQIHLLHCSKWHELLKWSCSSQPYNRLWNRIR